MEPTILRPNATGVYPFLSAIGLPRSADETQAGKKILDCGGGGSVPPVAVFAEQGMDAHALDIDPDQIAKARAFCERTRIPIELRLGDMRALPYDDEMFDYVYEHYSLCHLGRADTETALDEMRRVLIPGGWAFCGVISSDSWPLRSYGEERAPGEYWITEEGGERRHSMFSDRQAEALVKRWEVLQSEKVTRVLREEGERTSERAWRALRSEARESYSEAAWMDLYPDRIHHFTYIHAYYLLRKPLD